MKTCTKCGVTKPLEEYYARTMSLDGKRNDCKQCVTQKAKERYWRDVEQSRAKVREYKDGHRFYGETLATPTSKMCSMCRQVKPLGGFYKNSNTRDGYYPTCKECRNVRDKAKYWSDSERYKFRQRQYNRRTLCKPRECPAASLRPTTPTFRICTKCFIAQPVQWFMRYGGKGRNRIPKSICRDCKSIQARRNYANNPEKHRAYGRLWAKMNPEKARGKTIRRHARIKGATIVEKIGRVDVIAQYGVVCYLCNRTLAEPEVTVDHVVPISRGGQHTMDNLRPACAHCNKRKHAKLLSELSWYHDSTSNHSESDS